MTKLEIAKKIQLYDYPNNPWNHQIDVNGVVTPGRYRPSVESKFSRFSDVNFKGKKVLDLGCCEGAFLIKAAKLGAVEVCGVENEPQRIERGLFCIEQIGLSRKIDIVNRDVSEFIDEAIDSSYDIILALAILHHIKWQDKFMQNCLRILKPGGKLILESRGPATTKAFIQNSNNWWASRGSCGMVRKWIDDAAYNNFHFKVDQLNSPDESGSDWRWWTVNTKVKTNG